MFPSERYLCVLVDEKDAFLQNSFVSCAILTLPFLRTLRFSKKECSSESVTGHQLDTSAAAKVPTISTPSVLAISLRVLIVDDHLANRILLEAMLNKRSNQDVCYKIETVEDGLEAVQIASSRPYNIILMDCNMPIMDGWQVRISERHRNTKILRGSSCIQTSTLQLQVSGCMYARTNVLCQHPETCTAVNKYLHIGVRISASSHVCVVVRVYICLQTYVAHGSPSACVQN